MLNARVFAVLLCAVFTASCATQNELASGGSGIEPTADRSIATNREKLKKRTLLTYTVQHSRVATKCFPTRLKNILAKVGKKYGVPPVVKSGYRSPRMNRRVGGARNSAHMRCEAADISVKGVSHYKLARYLRSLPEVGGVGTYGCRGIVHVDVGKKRSWHYKCRKRRKR
ncbi:MAG: D-Ala-D-Ala carboxypeptidase family metallohydrolase [Pseudomonadota bacterium]